ncbi:MAG: PAS domain S-box protein [Sulfuritalea sp.]|nr:PAS domain S-box protein [Sulfuritalea sp.]
MRHSKETREQAVARMRAGDAPLLEIAREFSVSTNTLRAWLRESEARARALDSARRVATSLSREKYTSASQRQRLLMHALEQSPATIIVTDADGRIVYANPKFVATTGYRVDEALGQTPRLLKSGETSAEEYRRLWKTIKTGKEWRGVFHNRRKDGSLYWERASISPVHDAKGKITHFMAVKEDITAFMEAEAARRRTAAGFTAVFAALPFAIVLVDAAGQVVIANQAAEQLFCAAMPRGMRFDALNLLWVDAAGVALPVADHPLMRMLGEASDPSGVQMRIGVAPPKGGTRWLRCFARPLAMPETHEVAALLVLTEDCDDRK